MDPPLSPLTPVSSGSFTEPLDEASSSSRSRTGDQVSAFKRLSEEALQLNSRLWLSSLLSSPLAEQETSTVLSNGLVLARVSAALLAASQSGVSTVPPLSLRPGELEAGAAGGPRGREARSDGRRRDDAQQFVWDCRALGVRSVELCAAGDVSHPSAGSLKAVATCLHALAARARALGLQVPPFPTVEVSVPREETRAQRETFDRKASNDSLSSQGGGGGASSLRPSPLAQGADSAGASPRVHEAHSAGEGTENGGEKTSTEAGAGAGADDETFLLLSPSEGDQAASPALWTQESVGTAGAPPAEEEEVNSSVELLLEPPTTPMPASPAPPAPPAPPQPTPCSAPSLGSERLLMVAAAAAGAALLALWLGRGARTMRLTDTVVWSVVPAARIAQMRASSE
jgi:hypothetical protein